MRSILAAWLLLGVLRAQDEVPGGDIEQVKGDQARVEARLDSLRDKMERLAERYENEGRTRNARLLRDALARFEQDALLAKARELTHALDQELLSSIEQQDGLIGSLDGIYALLRDRKDLEELSEAANAARLGLLQLGLLAETERRLLADTRAASDRPGELVAESLEVAQALAEELARAGEALKALDPGLLQATPSELAAELERRQDELARAATEPASAADELVRQQSGLREALAALQGLLDTLAAEGESSGVDPEASAQADEAGARMEEAQRTLSSPQAPTTSAAEAMEQAAESLGELRETLAAAERQATAERNAARATARTASEQAQRQGQRLDELAGRLEAVEPEAGPELLDRTRQLLEELSALAPAVEQGDAAAAGASQQRAAADLAALIQALQQRARQAGAEAPAPPDAAALAALAEQQDDLQRQARQLMERLAELPDQAFKEPLDRAAGAMQRAAEALRGGATSEAATREEEAAEELERAEADLSGDRTRYEQLRQEEVLFRLQEEIVLLQQRQQEVSDETREIDAQLGEDGRLGRSQRRAVARLASTELDLSATAEGLRTTVAQDGAVTFDFALAAVRDDLVRVGELLADEETGPVTQAVQEDVRLRLMDLLAVLEGERERRSQAESAPPEEGQPAPSGEMPLVPPVAELLLIQRMEQMALNRLDNFQLGDEEWGDLERGLFERWAAEHERVTQLFLSMLPGQAVTPPAPEAAPLPEGDPP